ncbi:MAG: ATP-binding protein [Chloroflexota bacterium]
MRSRLLGWYLFLGGALLVGSLIFAATLRERAMKVRVETDLTLARSYAQSLTDFDELALWAESADIPEKYTALVVDANGNVLHTAEPNVDSTQSTDFSRIERAKPQPAKLQPDGSPQNLSVAHSEWLKQISRSARYATDTSFITLDPAGVTWLHTWTVTPAGGKFVLQQPLKASYIFPWWLIYLPVFTIGLTLTGGLTLWYLLSERWAHSVSRLVDLSETVRWRGFLRPQEQQEFQQLAEQRGRVGRLASSLLAMEQETQTRLTQLSTLLETGRVVTGSLHVDQVMDNILAQVQQLFQVERCALITLDTRADVFRIRASRGLTKGYVSRLRIATTEPNSPSMRALRNQQPIQIVDMETDHTYEPFRQRAQSEGNRSVLAIPLATVHASPAVLLVYKSIPYRYSYSELELANLVGTHAVHALENAALFARTDEQLQEQTQRLEAIVESLHDGLILESLDEQIVYSNQRAASLIGLQQRQMSGISIPIAIDRLLADADDPKSVLALIQAGGEVEDGQFTVDLTRTEQTGQIQDLRLHFFKVTDSGGELLGRGQLWQDITSDKELDRMKSSLISTVSHELRTPLATIKGYATTLLASDVQWDVETQQEFLETISSEADRLADLVQNLLDMSRIEAGTLEIHCEPFSLNQIVPEVVQTFPSDVEERVAITLTENLPLVSLDLPRIRTVMRNLLENAVKYSADASPIELQTYAQNGGIVCTVRDYGIGLPSEVPQDIFERFVRLDNSLTRNTGGFGLGLAICKGFIEAHDGKIWLQQEEKGVTFGFSLPVS